jgi:hypothetical protein
MVKLASVDEMFVICTVKKYFPPDNAFHQGTLIAIKFKKEGGSEIIVLNDEFPC